MLKWFSISGIRKEIKRIRWPHGKDLFSSSLTVIVFTFLFGTFFLICELVASGFLTIIGL